jgi:hypothetical protein
MISLLRSKAFNKFVIALLIAVVFTAVNFFLAPFGIIGLIIAGLANIILIMKLLDFEIFGAFIFAVAIGLFNGALAKAISYLLELIKK